MPSCCHLHVPQKKLAAQEPAVQARNDLRFFTFQSEEKERFTSYPKNNDHKIGTHNCWSSTFTVTESFGDPTDQM